MFLDGQSIQFGRKKVLFCSVFSVSINESFKDEEHVRGLECARFQVSDEEDSAPYFKFFFFPVSSLSFPFTTCLILFSVDYVKGVVGFNGRSVHPRFGQSIFHWVF